MISERKMANSYVSFWNQLLPTADTFVRQINIASERFYSHVPAVTKDRDKRAVINELAFRLFKATVDGDEITPELKGAIESEVRDYIEDLIRANVKIPPLSNEEVEESERISKSLSMYFAMSDLSALIFWPLFKGCGRISACRGDIIDGNKLIEVKAGDRNFKVTDIRQLMIYMALNFSSGQYPIKEMALVNPRTGFKYECDIDILIEFSSGRKAVDVFADIVDFISAETISK